jgi:hypothetical protein
LIDLRNSSEKAAFSIFKGYESKEYANGNSILAWEKVKIQYVILLLVKTERVFTLSSRLGNNKEP